MAVGAALVLPACGDNIVDEEPPVAELGSGAEAWEALGDPAVVLLIEGPQGGHHILGNVRVKGIDPGVSRVTGPEIEFAFLKADGTPASTVLPPFHSQLVDQSDGYTCLPFGRLIYMDAATDELLDQTLTYVVDLVDQNGRTAHDERQVIVKPYVP